MSEPTLLNGRYQIEGRLGNGGMAVVYRARDLTLDRTVAVKILREDYSSDPAFRERFHQEAKAAANLSHPSIVTIHDFGLDAGNLFIVMEYVPGTDLKTILQTRGRYNLDEAIPLLIQACAGIGYAHRAGLVHCDIKPQNMLVTPDQRLKVTDFGIARALASIHPDEKYNIVWGSPQYFSPEQAAGDPPSPASDVYSLGVVMYEMLAGRTPFDGSDAAELAHQHRDAAVPSPRLFNSQIPPSLEQIMLKVLAKEPSARYRTADQLGRVLMSYNKPTTVSPVVEAAHGPSQTTTRPAAPHPNPAPAQPVPQTQPSPAPVYQPASAPNPAYRHTQPTTPVADPLNIDWGTWAMAFVALIAVLGLIPFWTWIYLLYGR